MTTPNRANNMTDLFNLPPTPPPIEAQLRQLRESLADSERRLADAVENGQHDDVRDLRATCCRLSRQLAALEARIIEGARE